MAFRSQGQGWFYHAPARNEHKEPVGHPPLSQIPGLSNLSHLPPETENTRMWVKDTDSRYIQLAKAGGRPDLLRTHTPPPLSDVPVGYPRCEWYYDNLTSNNSQPAQPYEFGIPDYMVHMPLANESDKGEYIRMRAPFASDKTSVFDREGERATDKTIKLQEDRHQGYGVRAEKQQAKSRGGSANREGLQSSTLSSEPGNMTKLLRYGYAKDYDKQQEKWRQNLSRHGVQTHDSSAIAVNASSDNHSKKRY